MTNVENGSQVENPQTENAQSAAVVPLNNENANTNDNNNGDDTTPKGGEGVTTTPEPKKEDNGDVIKLKYLNLDFFMDVMSVPSYSRHERRMQTFILHWAKQHDIDIEMDKKGNLYLTKGKLEEGEFYPCLTSHMDTVQEKAKAYVDAGARLKINLTKQKVYTDKDIQFYGGEWKHKAAVDGMGIGADDKGGVLISLSIMEHFDKIKAVFFVEEEIGMMGSAQMDESFFDDCGYCIGWDSPDRNRAAYKSSGTKLFSAEFYTNFLKPICDEWDLTDFRSEPFTDITKIRDKTGLMCMNFGNGGYEAHMYTEYMILEDTDHALGMGIDLVKRLGNNLYKSLSKTKMWGVQSDGKVGRKEDEEKLNKIKEGETGDEAFFSEKFGYHYGNYYNNNNRSGSSSSSSSSSGSSSSSSSSTSMSGKKDDSVTIKYIADTYDAYLSGIKTSIEDVLKDFCEKNGLDYEDSLKDKIALVFSKSIKF